MQPELSRQVGKLLRFTAIDEIVIPRCPVVPNLMLVVPIPCGLMGSQIQNGAHRWNYTLFKSNMT
jgi:hypothetical protein